MKKIIVCSVLALVLLACSDSDNNKSETKDPSEGVVDTTVIGSDNPNPDTPDINSKTDSLKTE